MRSLRAAPLIEAGRSRVLRGSSYNQRTVSAISSTQPPLNLARHDGQCLLTAAEAILKSTLEAESPVALICGPRVAGFARVFDVAATDRVQQLLHDHGTSRMMHIALD